MRNFSNVLEHSVRFYFRCGGIPLLILNFVALSVTIKTHCSPSLVLTHTSELRVSIILRYSCACSARCPAGRWFLAKVHMADVNFSSKFGFGCRQRHGCGCLVLKSAFSARVPVRAKDSSELRFRALAFASAEANW